MTAGRRKLIYEDVLEVMQLSADGPVDAQMGRWVDGFDGFYGETAEALMRQEVDRLQWINRKVNSRFRKVSIGFAEENIKDTWLGVVFKGSQD